MTAQRYPAGLLELLGSKSSGINPDSIAPTIQGSVDLTQFYGLSQEAYKQEPNSGFTAIAEGAGLTLTVPGDQWWLLHDLSMVIEKTATATAGQFSLWQRNGTLGPFVGLASGPNQYAYPWGSTAAPLSLVAFFNPAIPRLLRPGTVLYGTCDILGTDARVNARLSARVGVMD